jgi:hypothetical protein
MSSSSQQASDFKKALQELDRDSAQSHDQQSEPSQSRMTLITGGRVRFRLARPSTTAISLKRCREEDEQTARFPLQKPKRRMLNPLTAASGERFQPIYIVIHYLLSWTSMTRSLDGLRAIMIWRMYT